MPLHGKIVVIKRSGGDGTEFPLTATCLFGRKPDCDIRIQLPQVSKEHCRIDLNENKEVILTNLSSVNPTRVNGEALQQSERLKHGDVITVIDRSFRFEYPPAPTPKKSSSLKGKTETLKVLQDQQVGDTSTVETGEKRISEVSTDPHLKDGANHDNIQRSLEKTVEVESKEDDSLLQNKTTSPFSDLYQMIKKSLDVKTPRRSSASQLQTPSSRFCTPKPVSVRKNDGKRVVFTEDKSTTNKDDAKVFTGAESKSRRTPESVKRQRKSFQVPPAEMAGPRAEETERATKSEATSPRKRNGAIPQRFTVCEVIEQVSAETPKSPMRRRSKEATPTKAAVTKQQEEQAMTPKMASPRNSGKAEKVKGVTKKRKSGELGTGLSTSQMKKKRVSFGSQLSPELFDKRLPPDSPLRKGAAPRRSLSLLKPKQSLLRRASAIGMLKEFEQGSLNEQSPAKMRRSPARGKSPSPNKVETPKANKQGKTQRKSTTPGQVASKETPTGKRRSSVAASSPASQENVPSTGVTPAKTPLSSRVETPTVQGRFSVSRISTPSPTAEVDAVADQVPAATVTPKIPLRRKSMKSASRKTPSIAKSAIKVMQRKSGISRTSMKLSNSWANIVKFGKTKAQVVAPAKKNVTQKTTKKAVSKPQTPARKVTGHVSTGHADSPVTIVVGRAHKQAVVRPTGAAPRLVTNTALFKKNMKMDEDLTGISEMFKTPVNERKRRTLINDNGATKTPAGGPGTSVIEPSVLNTPEEPGEMVVSPLTVKGRRYNSEAVQRLLGDQESSFVSGIPALEIHSEASEQQCTDLKTTSVTTPKQNPELPECLTGVKRTMKTPRQKAEPVEDLRGKLQKTPKQKPEQQECLTGVKRIMKTPKHKAEPVEDLRGKILKTPKQKVEQQECLTGVKRIMKTPRQKAEPLEDIRGKLLKTPKQKPEQQECLTGVKRIFKTPEQQVEPLEDLRGKLLKTPKAQEAGDVSLDGVEELLETPAHMQQSEDLSEVTGKKTPNTKSSPVACLPGIKRIVKTPKEKSAPVEDMVGVKRLMKTPREKGEPVEENFGIKRLMKSPRLRGNAPVEDFEGLQELMEEPLTDPKGQLETNEDEHQMPVDCGVDVATELDFAHVEPQDESDTIDNVPKVDMVKEANEVVNSDHLEVPSGLDNNESSDVMETLSQEQPKVDENLSEVQPEVEPAADKVTEMDPGCEKKSVRGRKAKTVESKAARPNQEAPETSEEPVLPAPVRGRRGKKTEAAAPPAVRQTARGRNAKTAESTAGELTVEESAPQPPKVAPKPRRGRNAKKASAAQAEVAEEVVTEPESEQKPPADVVEHKANDSAAPLEKAVLKPKRGRKTKPEQSVPEQQADTAKADANEDRSDQLVVSPGGADENKSSDAMETPLQAPETESIPDVEITACEVTEIKPVVVQKKSVRGRRAKLVDSKEDEEKREAAEYSEEPSVPAPVRGRRGKKVEATAPPAARQTTRTRNAKSQENTSDQPDAETQLMTEISTVAASAQTPLINASQEEHDSAPPAEEAVVKPLRGRKTKQTPVEPEKNEAVSDQHLVANAQPEQPIVPTAGRPRRGRKTKADAVEQNEVAEATVVTVETSQQSQPPVRAKRGRSAKQEEEKKDNSDETTKSQEPAKKLRRTRKPEQDHVEPSEEVQTIDMDVPEKAAAPLAEPVTVSEQATVAAKPRRGGRKAKQDAESVSPVETTGIQEVPVVSSTDKPKQGRRGKQVAEEIGATAVNPEKELEAEEQKNAEPVAQVIKPSKARGAKTSVKNEVSQAIPTKRARRGAALEETNAESAVLVSESASTSIEPPKRGRRAAAAKPATDEATLTSDQANPSEDLNNAIVEDKKMSKRSVKWKSNIEVFEIPKATPVKSVRGRKSKLGDQVDADGKNVSKDANKTEEEDLSDKVVDAQPAKRARRGVKVVDDKAGSTTDVDLKGVGAETQPKTRRGRSAKK